MILSHIALKNWRNFPSADVSLGERVFLVGPNACGKSNFLDVFRFLRDIVKAGGGLQKSLQDRGGLSKVRCLAARQNPDVAISVSLAEGNGTVPAWKYEIGIKQEVRGYRQPHLSYERVWEGDTLLLDRPNKDDKKDKLRLTQTHLEQINANEKFREIAAFFQSVLYLHLVPQLLRHPSAFSGTIIPDDPFGRNFLERITQTPERTRRARLKKIEKALQKVVPQFKQLFDTRDEHGIAHLEAVYEHWRARGARQREDQFSDGTLRLIGLFWALMEGKFLLLLEEPELSLHISIIKKLAPILHCFQHPEKRQVILSTHSADLLSDKGIGGEEVLLLTPTKEGTQIRKISDIEEVRALLECGSSIADIIVPYTEPPDIHQNGVF